MYHKGGMMELPPSNAPIWRFTDITKLLAMLESQSLWFSSVANLEDPYEAYIQVPTLDEWREFRMYEEVYVDVKEEDIECLWECEMTNAKHVRQTLFENSWHRNDYESAAMWKLYLSHSEGIAIRSTVGRLIDSFQNIPQRILMGMINYVDYEKHPVPNNVYCRAILKRKSFEHERELRAVYYDPYTNSGSDTELTTGTNIGVNLDILIDSIYVAPTAPMWMRDLVEAVVKRYDLQKSIRQSVLKSKPIW